MPDYSFVDWEPIVKILVPSPQYGYVRAPIYKNQSGYERDITWQDARPKPGWAEIINTWTKPNVPGSGVRLDRNAPSDIKICSLAEDHYQWLYIHPDNGRVVEKMDYPILYHVLGDTYNNLYTGITASQFGLPIPGGKTPIFAKGGMPIGKQGGKAAVVLALSVGIPGNVGNNQTETSAYWVAGNCFMFAGELRYM